MQNRIQRRIFLCSVIPVFAILVISCASEPVDMSVSMEPPINMSSSDIELYPGDEIEIKFAYVPEFNETQMIRTDGKIELLLVGEVVVEGKSPSQVKGELTELYSKHLSHPELVVILRASYRNRVYVGGAVNTPGVLNLDGEKTILEAITEMGGFDLDTANISDVLLIRPKGRQQHVYSIDVKSYLTGKNSSMVYLQPQDVVYVPRSKIVNMANYLERIWTIIPFRFSATYVFDNEDIEDIFD